MNSTPTYNVWPHPLVINEEGVVTVSPGTLRALTNRRDLALLDVSHAEAIDSLKTMISRDFQKRWKNLNKSIRRARRAAR